MITIKDYAKKHGVSYEAIRKQVKLYQADLDGLIIKKNRTQYLTPEAETFLDSKRSESIVIINAAAKDEENERLRNEREALLLKVAALQEELLAEKNKVVQLLEEKQEQVLLLETEKNSYTKTWFGLYKKKV